MAWAKENKNTQTAWETRSQVPSHDAFKRNIKIQNHYWQYIDQIYRSEKNMDPI